MKAFNQTYKIIEISNNEWMDFCDHYFWVEKTYWFFKWKICSHYIGEDNGEDIHPFPTFICAEEKIKELQKK